MEFTYCDTCGQPFPKNGEETTCSTCVGEIMQQIFTAVGEEDDLGSGSSLRANSDIVPCNDIPEEE